MVLVRKEAREPLRRDVVLDRLWIDAIAPVGHGLRAHVGREHLKLWVLLRRSEFLYKEHSQGIGLLPVLQPGTQIRIGRSSGCWRTKSGMIDFASASKAAGSRKKLVTWISRSFASSSSSEPSSRNFLSSRRRP